jgi:hypothetical protein
MENIPYKTACTNGLPDDEHMMFETCKRRKELNYNINLESVHFVGLSYVIVSQCTVQKHILNTLLVDSYNDSQRDALFLKFVW